MNVGIVTLGCSKNQVDSEMILGLFKSVGYNIVNKPDEADVIIINTCGFINSAKKEAIDTILEMAEYKKSRCKALIVTGCLAKRYKADIIRELPEVDLVIGVDEYGDIGNILSKFLSQKFLNHNLDFTSRVVSTNFPLSYVRISDGCDNRCSYCAIPLIRGPFKSRKMEDIIGEVEGLAKNGISEICIISQDTTKYGKDIYGKLMLAELLNKISRIHGIKWIRILYMYTFEVTDELIEEISSSQKICPYFDIPIQHGSDRILKAMNRYDTKEKIYNLVHKIRERIPNAIIRTTVITGFPGETNEDFEELKDLIRDLKFDRLSGFTYSREEDTKAYFMKPQIPEKVKVQRLKEIMDIQKEISLEHNRLKVGNKYSVIVENITDDEKYFVCRSYMEAPDVDGRIYVKIDDASSKKAIIGEYSDAKIIDYNEYDLFAEFI